MSENNLDHLSTEEKSELMKNIEIARKLMGEGTKIIIANPTGENTFEDDLNKELEDENKEE